MIFIPIKQNVTDENLQGNGLFNIELFIYRKQGFFLFRSIIKQGKIIILQKADSFSIEEHASTTEAINKIMGDFRFQTLPILRWVECARLTKKNVFLTEWEHKCRNMIVKLVNNSQLIKVNIPSVYSQDIYSKLENVIK